MLVVVTDGTQSDLRHTRKFAGRVVSLFFHVKKLQKKLFLYSKVQQFSFHGRSDVSK